MGQPERLSSILGAVFLRGLMCEDRAEARGRYSAAAEPPERERRRYSAEVTAEPVVFRPEPGRPRSPKGRAERPSWRSVERWSVLEAEPEDQESVASARLWVDRLGGRLVFAFVVDGPESPGRVEMAESLGDVVVRLNDQLGRLLPPA